MGCASSSVEHDRMVASNRSLWKDEDEEERNHQPTQQSNWQPTPRGQGPPSPPSDAPNLQVNRENVLAYLEVDQKVREAEARNIKMRLLTKQKNLSDLNQTINDLRLHYQNCMQRTAKEKADVDQLKQTSVLEFFKDQSQYDAAMSKEQEEYLEAINEQEVAEKELEGVKNQQRDVTSEVEQLFRDMGVLEELQQKQDEMLKGFFNGNYGSDRENILESELDLLLDRQQRVMVSKDKWQNGRLLLYHACTQLSTGNNKWQEVASIPPGNLQRRYYVATEARNQLIAASQNISNTGRLLSGIRFPYCTPDEIHTLNRAIAHVYTDMQSGDRHAHAAQCYYITHKRTAALLLWFDQVIDKRIIVDLDKARQEAKMKGRELRNERVRLLKQKYLENTGETINVPDVMDPEDDVIEESPKAAVFEADAVSGAEQLPKGDENDSLSTNVETKARVPTPIPINELAPPPSQEEMFGNLHELQARHEKEMVEFEKAQETNRARQEQGLHEKLRERRSRRARQEANELSG